MRLSALSVLVFFVGIALLMSVFAFSALYVIVVSVWGRK